jgi:hypothetical protein
MSAHTDVPPSTVGVDLVESGVEVEYVDGRKTFYRGVPEPVTGTLTTPPKKETHVLVTDPTETEGVLLYINDLKTHDDILESSGVGRVILDDGESEEVFPGVTIRRPGGMRTEVEADPEIARGRVFVFVEDDWSEQSYEFVADTESEGDSGSDAGAEPAESTSESK